MDAQDVLNNMVRRYAALRSYSDVGDVTVTRKQRDIVMQTRFSTF
jgi:hypothetical protein